MADDGWTVTTLGEICPFKYGKGLPAAKRDDSGSVRVYGSNGVVGSHASAVTGGPTIVIGRKGSVGAVHYSPEPCWPIDTTFYVETADEFTARYIYYLLKTVGLEHMNSDSAVPGLNRDAAHARVVLVPTAVDERRAIASVLASLDDKIELNRRMAQTLEEMARALFKSWFVDFDPVRAKAEGRDPGLPKHLADLFPDRFVDSELGEIPEGWSCQSLDDVARFLNGLAMQKFPPEVGVPTLPVIKIAQLRSGSTLGADLASSALKPDYIVKDGDILFSWSGTLECVYWSGGPGALNQHLFKVIPNGTPHSICYLAVHEYLEYFRGIAAGKATTMGHIQRRDLNAAKLAIPPSDLLLAIGDVLDAILERSCSCQVEARSLARLRDSLLPQLVSGEVRLPDPEGLLARLEAAA